MIYIKRFFKLIYYIFVVISSVYKLLCDFYKFHKNKQFINFAKIKFKHRIKHQYLFK